MGVLERIKEIEAEMARTQKNKATEKHLGILKAKLAKLRTELIEGGKSTAVKGEGFDVLKSGDARVALIGFPSVGKSSLLAEVTTTESVAASYEFTTLTCIPGVIHYRDAQIQLLDLPGIIEGAAKGVGRGRQVIAVARTSDLVLMMLDATKGDEQRPLLEHELETVGIRLNQRPPDIYYRKKPGGGVQFNSTVALTHCDEELVRRICHEYRIHNCELLFREDATVEQLIDVLEGNRVYIPCMYAYNKIDAVSLEEVDDLARRPHATVMSVHSKLNLDGLLEDIWRHLDFLRVYTKPKGQAPDLTEPLILRRGSTIEHVCHNLHRDLASNFKYALCWGKSAKHTPQRVGLKHQIEDEDVVQIMTK